MKKASPEACFFSVSKKFCDFFARFKTRQIFAKLCFTKNLAMLVKKPDNSGVFDGYNLI